MSQWGAEKSIGSARFLAHVETNCFEPASGDSLVDLILLLDNGEDPVAARASLATLEDQFVGKPYADWLSHTG